jgi:hypothetical protein
MLTLQWSVVDWLWGPFAHPQDVHLAVFGMTFVGTKEQLELKFRAWVSAVALALVFAVEITDVYLPRARMLEFRKAYLDAERATWREVLSPDIRLNIMHARRSPVFLFYRVFDWTWNDGFDPPRHQDANLFLTEFQGVCGLTLRSERAFLADLRAAGQMSFAERWFLRNRFRLFKWQLDKTRNTKAVLSVPMFVERKAGSAEAKKWRAVGVINLDTDTDAGAALLQDRQDDLVTYFGRVGKVVAKLR